MGVENILAQSDVVVAASESRSASFYDCFSIVSAGTMFLLLRGIARFFGVWGQF
jgi:hypothetical protein